MNDLIRWLDSQNIDYRVVDSEVVDIPEFGRLFRADLSGVKSIFRQRGDEQVFNLMEDPQTLIDEGIFHVAFPFGDNWYYYDLRDEFSMNILKHIGRPKPDGCDIPFVNLGVHTPYELLNGSGDIASWVVKAKWLGQTALGIADRNTLAASLVLQKECARAGLKHVFGYSLTLDHEEGEVPLKVYCQTQQGFQNLLRIQKAVMVDREDGRIDIEALVACGRGNVLVLGTLAAYWMTQNRPIIVRLREAFDALFYQIDPTEFKADRIDVQRLESMRRYFHAFCRGGAFEVEPVLIPDSYYIDRDDARSKIVLNKIATGAAHEQSDEQYLRSAGELLDKLRPLFDPARWDVDELFRRMCRNTGQIAEGAEARFETGRMYMPRYDMTSEEKLRYGDRHRMFLALLDEGLERKIPQEDHARYRERLRDEVYIIESTNNVDYFLIQWDIMQEAHRRGIVTGIGRGSAGGSLVSYLLEIISIDPLEYDLLFSRFLVPERCGLYWQDEVTKFCGRIDLPPGSKYVELQLDGHTLRFERDARLRILRGAEELTVYADELRCDDELILDNKDMLWNMDEHR
nr:MAG TPA: DNA polymerase III, alpha subunit [Caudoviricetes sp.]